MVLAIIPLAGWSSPQQDFKELEKKYDARLGIYVIDTATNKKIAYHANERFAFTSTYKALAAGVLLQNASLEQLETVILYTKDDLVAYSPVTELYTDTGMTLREISEAAVRYSDNTAGNLLFHAIGGPKGFEQSLRKMGDKTTYANRFETELNTAIPGDKRDTSTAKALAIDLKKYTIDSTLSIEKRQLLLDWMADNKTGDALIRAGVPTDWKVVDKSGAGSYGTRNDIAVVFPPNRAPIVLAILSSRSEQNATYDNQLIEEATRVIIKSLH
ncbi:class A beta-lactamase [Kurthia populi]|uniref:Beta-lactamase n=1 Tax=Kurthia populi TaxID=1562132 RepID=A0ABW5Y2T0_9BACL